MPFKFNPTTGKLDLVRGVNPLRVGAVQFDINHTPLPNAEGLLQWNATDGTLDLGMDGGEITQQIGQELFTKVRNQSGSTILNGRAVYFSGRLGNRPLISLSKADAEATSRVAGITTEDIISPDDGFITTAGYVRGIKTDYTGTGIWGTTWAEGDLLYVSKTDAGVLTNVEPASPHHSDVIGSVGIVHSNLGSILVSLDRHKTLAELSDVDGSPLVRNGQLPIWDNDRGVFDFEGDVDLGNHTLKTGGTQAGQSTIASGLVVNDNGGNGSADDFRAETVSNPNAFVVDASADKVLIGIDTAFDTNTLYVDTVNNRVGVGTATPLSKLSVIETGITQEDGVINASTYGGRMVDVQGNGGAYFRGRDVTNDIEFLMGTSLNGYAMVGAASNHPLVFRTNNLEKARIDISGNFGIGTSSPQSKLHIYDGSANLYFDGNEINAIDSTLYLKSLYDFSIQPGGGVTAMTVKADGNVGIGTTTPSYKLDVRGTSASDVINSNMGYNTNRVTAPTVPTATAVAGTGLSIGTYYYFITYTTAIGETGAGAVATVITTAGNEKVELTNIPISTDPRVTGRKIYRTKVGATSDVQYYLAALANNTATTYTDTTPDASLTGVPGQSYKVNTTSKQITVDGLRALFIDNNLTALGISAGDNIIATNGAAIRSVLIGTNSGRLISTGQSNTAIGALTLYNATTANGSTVVGDLAGYAITTGGSNTAMGAQAARYIAGGSGNAVYGNGAGSTLNDGSTQLTTPTNGIYIGKNSRGYSATEDNAIVIGYLALGKGSNTVVIGNSSITQNYLTGAINQSEITKTFSGSKVLTDGTPTNFLDVAVATGEMVGGNISYTIYVTNGTDYQAHTGGIGFVAVNKAGTVTCDMKETYVPATEVEIATAGTLSDTPACTAGASKVTLSMDANTSLAGATITMKYTVEFHSMNTLTAL